MNTQTNNRNAKVLVLLGLVICSLVYAVATFWPSTTPTVTLGKYALKSRDLSEKATKAYRPWFENGSWQGDIIEYNIGQDGSRTTDADVGSNPPTATGTNWMARATFRANGADDPTGNYWENREIITVNSQTKQQVPFWWDELAGAQKTALDPETLNDPNGDGDTSDAITPTDSSTEGDKFSPTLKYIRGDRSLESDQTNGYMRKRYSVLGDITNSPLYVGPPTELFSAFEGYSGFFSTYNDRPGVIAAPANDGMLHFFAESGGSELLAYIPSMVIDKLKRLKERDYQHTYYVDGELVAGSAQIDPDPEQCATDIANSVPNPDSCGWKTVVTSGGGHGFEGLFALDLTAPVDPTVTGYANNRVLFEKTGGDFGQIYGPPVIAPLGTPSEPHWYIFTGNGYKTTCTGPDITCNTDTTRPSKLLMVSLNSLHTVYGKSAGTSMGGLSSPALINSDMTDLMPELAFAGDINGDLWMFKLNKTSPDSSSAYRVFYGHRDANDKPDQPITNTPAIVKHPTESGYMVYFGTGSVFSAADANNDTDKQAIYGIWIKQQWIDDPTTITPITPSQLVEQKLNTSPVTGTFNGETKNLRTIPDEKPITYSCNTGDTECISNQHPGWKVIFPNCGERLIGSPFPRAERIQFVTTNPSGADSTNCAAAAKTLTGDSWVMSLDYLTGGSNGRIVYNLDDKSELDSGDTVDGVPPVGLGLGQGNISQPAFVRLSKSTATRDAIDKMFINGIILPLPTATSPGPLLFGHIDVSTDSPRGGTTAPNEIYKQSEDYNVSPPGDGLGKAVDGHFHDYDTVNGVSYVDLLQLEPRRDLTSLAASATTPQNGDCGNTANHMQAEVSYKDKDGNTVTKCVDTVEPELNRAYDPFKTKLDTVSPSGDPEGLPRWLR